MTCSYHDQEFFRVGYYVNNFYEDPELNENPPSVPEISKLTRHILIEKPRVTKFQVEWDDAPMVDVQAQEEQLMGQYNDENQNYSNIMNGGQQQTDADGLMQKGSQYQERNNMMSHTNLAEAAQNFNL